MSVRSLPTGTTPFVRTCASSVYGQLAKGWRDASVVVGPLAFAYLRDSASAPPGDFQPRGDRLPGLKVLAVVEQGQTVTVAIPASQRRRATLIYDPSKWTSEGLMRLQDGDPAVTFQACKPGASPYGAAETQFNGGFLVVGPRCLDLAVWVNNATRPRAIRVSFGAGRCG